MSHWILKQTFANMWGDVLTVVSEEEDFEKEIDHGSGAGIFFGGGGAE